MLVKEPTSEMYEEWKSLWNKYKNKLKTNRKSGKELLDYLSKKYILTYHSHTIMSFMKGGNYGETF